MNGTPTRRTGAPRRELKAQERPMQDSPVSVAKYL